MTTNILTQNYSEVLEYKQSLPAEDIRRRIMIFQLTDDWVSDIQKGVLQESYAALIRSQFNQLCEYYTLIDQKNKAKLAINLHNSMFFAETEGLTIEQVYVVQYYLCG